MRSEMDRDMGSTPDGEDAATRLSAKHESPVAEGQSPELIWTGIKPHSIRPVSPLDAKLILGDRYPNPEDPKDAA